MTFNDQVPNLGCQVKIWDFKKVKSKTWEPNFFSIKVTSWDLRSKEEEQFYVELLKINSQDVGLLKQTLLTIKNIWILKCLLTALQMNQHAPLDSQD